MKNVVENVKSVPIEVDGNGKLGSNRVSMNGTIGETPDFGCHGLGLSLRHVVEDASDDDDTNVGKSMGE